MGRLLLTSDNNVLFCLIWVLLFGHSWGAKGKYFLVMITPLLKIWITSKPPERKYLPMSLSHVTFQKDV